MNVSIRSHSSQKRRWLPILCLAFFLSLILFLLLYRLNDWPTILWDDGWTLSAARNWIEQGHLGNYLLGQPIPPRIPLRFPVVVPVALTMRIFGIGVWQGRLPGVIFTILALGFYYYLTSKIHDRRTGLATLLFVLGLSPYIFNPIFLGRQLLAEMPMMFYLLGGYVLVWLALTRSPAWGVGAAIFFGIAIHAKLQVPPFWLISMALAIWMAIVKHQMRSVKILAWISGGSVVVAVLVYVAQNWLMPGSFDDPALINMLLNTSVIVLSWPVRIKALAITGLFALPQLVGFIWVGRTILKDLLTRKAQFPAEVNQTMINQDILRTAIWGLGISWLIWYATMSQYWARYLFPSFFLGYIFVSALVSKLSSGFDLRLIIQRFSTFVVKRKFDWPGFASVMTVLGFALAVGLTIGSIRIGLMPTSWQPDLAGTYLRDNIPDGALIESYEAELYFFAPEYKYHFPSDLVSMQLFRRISVDPQYNVYYDPLEANPDYLVVGPFARNLNMLTDGQIQQSFQLDADIGGYQIYHRIRILANK